MNDAGRTAKLERFAAEYERGDLAVRRAAITPDVRQDGEPVTRVLLLLTDPVTDTWDIDGIRELRVVLGREATNLGLPPVSLTLVAESDAEASDAFR